MSHAQEAAKLLEDLDSFAPEEQVSSKSAHPQSTNDNEAEALAFLDEITQKSSEPTPRTVQLERPLSRSGTPTLRKTTDRIRVGGGPISKPAESTSKPKNAEQPPAPSTSQSGGGWGWGSVWSTASAAISQAKHVVDERVKALPQNEQAKKWRDGVVEYAKNAQLDKLSNDFKRVGMSTLTDILNVVAPPIAEHEVIQVWLSHDMKGYEGVESLAYRALAKVMEQVKGGDLVLNRGEESKPKGSSDTERDLNYTDSYDAAIKLAQANIDQLVKSNVNPKKSQPSATQTPTTYSHIYLRIQPYTSSTTVPGASKPLDRLHFLLYLYDPEHQLVQLTTTQSIPAHWLDIWDQYDWVEDSMADALRVGIEVIGQEYVVARMGWAKDKDEDEAEDEEEDEEEEESNDDDNEEDEEGEGTKKTGA